MKWFEVDFNSFPHRVGILVNRPTSPDNWYVEHHTRKPEDGEIIMAYTMDDDPPFAYQMVVTDIVERTDVYSVRCEYVEPRIRYEFVPKES